MIRGANFGYERGNPVDLLVKVQAAPEAFYIRRRGVVLVADTQVDRKPLRGFPVVLKVGPIAGLPRKRERYALRRVRAIRVAQ